MTDSLRPRTRSRRRRMAFVVAPLTVAALAGGVGFAQANPFSDRARRVSSEAGEGLPGEDTGDVCLTAKQARELRATVRKLRAQMNALGGIGDASPPATASPTAVPTEPTIAPTDPTGAPTEPTTAPTDPTGAPTEPTGAPTSPTQAPGTTSPPPAHTSTGASS